MVDKDDQDELRPFEIMVGDIKMQRVIPIPDNAGACGCAICNAEKVLSEPVENADLTNVLKKVVEDDTKIKLWPRPLLGVYDKLKR